MLVKSLEEMNVRLGFILTQVVYLGRYDLSGA